MGKETELGVEDEKEPLGIATVEDVEMGALIGLDGIKLGNRGLRGFCTVRAAD